MEPEFEFCERFCIHRLAFLRLLPHLTLPRKAAMASAFYDMVLVCMVSCASEGCGKTMLALEFLVQRGNAEFFPCLSDV